MKGNTVILVAGGAMVVGAMVYARYKCLQKHKSTTQHTPKDNHNRTFTSEVACDGTPLGENIVIHFEQTQRDIAASIRKHHQEAVHQLKDTLHDIEQDSADFKEKINQVNNDLDELLK